ncbi:MAG: DUF4864 domain-containing protein [Myxococcota bacterium]
MLHLLTSALFAFSADAQPSPELGVEAVVRVQLEALKLNPQLDDDAGIRLAFRFASPSNRAQTGPIERFIPMVKAPAYAPLLGFDSSSVVVMNAKPSGAHVVVEVRRGSKTQMYMWVLSLQENGCWMTDAVVPVEPEGEEAPELLQT